MFVLHPALTDASFVLAAAVVGTSTSIFLLPYEFAQPWYLQALRQFFMFLPLLYLLCRFTAVLEMHDGHYRFSQILISTLTTYLAFSGVYGSGFLFFFVLRLRGSGERETDTIEISLSAIQPCRSGNPTHRGQKSFAHERQ